MSLEELPRLSTAWDVDRRIVLDSAEKLVIVRFSSYERPSSDSVLPYSGPSPNETSDAEGEDVGRTKRARHESDRADLKSRSTSAVALSPSCTRSSVLTSRVPSTITADTEHHTRTLQVDAMLQLLRPKVRKYCVVYTVDTTQVPEFNDMYELGHDRDPFALMFFFRNRHIRIDVGTGNNNKINFFAFEEVDELVQIVNAAYRAGKQGLTMASSEKKYTTASVRR